MIQLTHAADRHPMDIEFGPLRALLDKTLAPEAGIHTHPHNEIEITTIVLAGEMTHKDAREVVNIIPAGHVHHMSAGTGVTHAEFNLGAEPARFLQIWIDPDVHGVPPAYETQEFPPKERRGRLQPIATGDDDLDGIMIYADATIYLADLEARDSMQWVPEVGRRTFIYVYDGSLDVNGGRAVAGDELRIQDETTISLTTHELARFVLIDLPAT